MSSDNANADLLVYDVVSTTCWLMVTYLFAAITDCGDYFAADLSITSRAILSRWKAAPSGLPVLTQQIQ